MGNPSAATERLPLQDQNERLPTMGCRRTGRVPGVEAPSASMFSPPGHPAWRPQRVPPARRRRRGAAWGTRGRRGAPPPCGARPPPDTGPRPPRIRDRRPRGSAGAVGGGGPLDHANVLRRKDNAVRSGGSIRPSNARRWRYRVRLAPARAGPGARERTRQASDHPPVGGLSIVDDPGTSRRRSPRRRTAPRTRPRRVPGPCRWPGSGCCCPHRSSCPNEPSGTPGRRARSSTR
jgi:hypothetical protein